CIIRNNHTLPPAHIPDTNYDTGCGTSAVFCIHTICSKNSDLDKFASLVNEVIYSFPRQKLSLLFLLLSVFLSATLGYFFGAEFQLIDQLTHVILILIKTDISHLF